MTGVLSSDIITGLADANWKTRLAAVEQFMEVCNIVGLFFYILSTLGLSWLFDVSDCERT